MINNNIVAIIQKNCTIIIPAHNNDKYLARSIEYWLNEGITPLVIDSSVYEYEGDISRVQYVYRKNSSFQEKIIYAIKYHVHTKYIVICAMDDYMTISGIYECIVKMEDNEKACSCQGLAYVYSIENKSIDIKFAYKQILEKNLIDENPYKRVKKLLFPYHQLLYAVCKKDQMYKAMKSCTCFSDVKKGGIMEIVMSVSIVLQGTSLTIKKPYWIRESNPNSWGKNIITYKEWIQGKENEEEILCVQRNLNRLYDENKNIMHIISKYYGKWIKRYDNSVMYFIHRIRNKINKRKNDKNETYALDMLISSDSYKSIVKSISKYI